MNAEVYLEKNILYLRHVNPGFHHVLCVSLDSTSETSATMSVKADEGIPANLDCWGTPELGKNRAKRQK